MARLCGARAPGRKGFEVAGATGKVRSNRPPRRHLKIPGSPAKFAGAKLALERAAALGGIGPWQRLSERDATHCELRG